MSSLEHPVLVVSYSDNAREAITADLLNHNVSAVPCSMFSHAEELALHGIYNGIVVDLPSIIKAKGEEKDIAYTLTNFYPALRVRSMGTTTIPMIMPGETKQDNCLQDFIFKTCMAFPPRKLRYNRRREISLSAIKRYAGGEERSFTLNVSWGGAFIIDSYPERYNRGDELALLFHELNIEVTVTVCWLQHWGQRRFPGIGVKFQTVDNNLENVLYELLKNEKHTDRDRVRY